MGGIFWRFNRFYIVTVFLLAGGASGCYTLEVQEAFQGKFSFVKNNKVINEYCQSCHIHKSFDASDHVTNKRKLYERKPYRLAKSCRACHYVEKEWAREELIRKTRYPREVKLGLYKEFEEEFMEEK